MFFSLLGKVHDAMNFKDRYCIQDDNHVTAVHRMCSFW